MDAADATGTIPVSIYGRTYQLRGNEERDYLLELAALVDRRMRETAAASGTADTLKVAILAALNIADDYLQARRGASRKTATADPDGDERLVRLVGLLDEALAG
jgi:cell division protein ZapA